MATKKLETFHSATIKIECPMFDSAEERDAYLLAIRNLLCASSCISLIAWHHKGEEQQPWYTRMAGKIDIDGKKSNVGFLATRVELLQDDDGSDPYLKEHIEGE